MIATTPTTAEDRLRAAIRDDLERAGGVKTVCYRTVLTGRSAEAVAYRDVAAFLGGSRGRAAVQLLIAVMRHTGGASTMQILEELRTTPDVIDVQALERRFHVATGELAAYRTANWQERGGLMCRHAAAKLRQVICDAAALLHMRRRESGA